MVPSRTQMPPEAMPGKRETWVLAVPLSENSLSNVVSVILLIVTLSNVLLKVSVA